IMRVTRCLRNCKRPICEILDGAVDKAGDEWPAVQHCDVIWMNEMSGLARRERHRGRGDLLKTCGERLTCKRAGFERPSALQRAEPACACGIAPAHSLRGDPGR